MSKNTKQTLNLGACPACGNNLSDITVEEYGARPRDGDLALCYECGAYLMMDGGKMRAVPIAELNTLGLSVPAALMLVLTHNEIITRNKARDAHLN